MDAFRLDGEKALITGGGTGLGFGIATSFVEAGAEVMITGRREHVLRQACEKLGPASCYEVHDVTDLGSNDDFIARADERLGGLSILVNNAGIHLKKPAEQTETHEFNAMLQTHVVAAFSLSRAALGGMVEREHGSVLFISSMTAMFGLPYVIAYSAAKSAYTGMVRSLSTEVSDKGVRVNAIAPGWIDSPMLRRVLDADPDRKERILQRTPMHRLGEAEDIGHAATYLCSPAGKFITGVILPIDGGASIGF